MSARHNVLDFPPRGACRKTGAGARVTSLEALGGRVMLVAGDPGAALDGFVTHLAREMSGDSVLLARAADLSPDGAGTAAEEHERFDRWLAHARRQARWVLLDHAALPSGIALGDAADSVLLVCEANAPLPAAVREALESAQAAGLPVELVLLHPRQTSLPSGTARWLDVVRPTEHHHVRLGHDGDHARVARRLTGRAVALVLGSGGARGFAHLGVWRALVEAGQPIDLVGGSSMGSVIAAQIALGWDQHIAAVRTRDIFLKDGGIYDWRLSPVSLIAGDKLTTRVRAAYGEYTDVEDLWLPWFCVTSNLTRALPVVHRRGQLWKLVRASGSIPGLAPPVELDGELHVDGGMLDTLPVQRARDFGASCVIAVNVLRNDPRRAPRTLPDGTGVMQLLWRRYGPRHDRSVPALPDVVRRSLRLAVLRQGQVSDSSADVSIEPPVERFSLLDPRPIDQIIAAGHQSAVEALRGWQKASQDGDAQADDGDHPRAERLPAALLDIAPPQPGPTRLPQYESLTARHGRAAWLQAARRRYEWELVPGLPSQLKQLPKEEAYPAPSARTALKSIAAGGAHTLAGELTSRTRRWRSLDVFDRLLPASTQPVRTWREDHAFARQRLAGPDPTLIELCEEIPGNFAVTETLVRDLLPPGTTLEGEAKERRVFLCDYSMLDGLYVEPGRYLAAPLVLFHRHEGELQPIAIQLSQDPSKSVVFTPRDSHWDWLAAKTYVQSAEAHHHELVSDLYLTHYYLEPFVVAARRQLHPTHPVAVLLAPHFAQALAANAAARERATTEGGMIDRLKATRHIGGLELMQRLHKETTFESTAFHAGLAARGVLDAAILPDYPFRDDGLLLHGTLGRYVREVLAVFYRSAVELHVDAEIQGFAAELADPARGGVRGFPARFETVEQLASALTEIIFRCTGWDSAVSHGHAEAYAHVPNMPHALYRPPPRGRGEVDERWLVEALPDRRRSMEQILATLSGSRALMHRLTRPDQALAPKDATARKLRDGLTAEMCALSEQIRRRNEQSDRPYRALDPAEIGEGLSR